MPTTYSVCSAARVPRALWPDGILTRKCFIGTKHLGRTSLALRINLFSKCLHPTVGKSVWKPSVHTIYRQQLDFCQAMKRQIGESWIKSTNCNERQKAVRVNFALHANGKQDEYCSKALANMQVIALKSNYTSLSPVKDPYEGQGNQVAISDMPHYTSKSVTGWPSMNLSNENTRTFCPGTFIGYFTWP